MTVGKLQVMKRPYLQRKLLICPSGKLMIGCACRGCNDCDNDNPLQKTYQITFYGLTDAYAVLNDIQFHVEMAHCGCGTQWFHDKDGNIITDEADKGNAVDYPDFNCFGTVWIGIDPATQIKVELSWAAAAPIYHEWTYHIYGQSWLVMVSGLGDPMFFWYDHFVMDPFQSEDPCALGATSGIDGIALPCYDGFDMFHGLPIHSAPCPGGATCYVSKVDIPLHGPSACTGCADMPPVLPFTAEIAIGCTVDNPPPTHVDPDLPFLFTKKVGMAYWSEDICSYMLVPDNLGQFEVLGRIHWNADALIWEGNFDVYLPPTTSRTARALENSLSPVEMGGNNCQPSDNKMDISGTGPFEGWYCSGYLDLIFI